MHARQTPLITLLGSFANLLFPPLCQLCAKGVTVRPEGLFCAACLKRLKEVGGEVCRVCGTPFIDAASGTPPKDAAPVCARTCGACLKGPPRYLAARSGFYYEGALAEAICRFKYGGETGLCRALAGLLAGSARALPAVREFDIVVPVPLHVSRLRKRGFNQSLLLARELAGSLSIALDYSGLRRTRNTAPQVRLSDAERRKNVRGAFDAAGVERFRGKRVLLVDDVYTTGATVRECSKTLKRAGAEVSVITLARVALI